MQVLIITYNRLTLPVNLANWVAARGCEPIFIDNHSDYLPLLNYYKTTPYEVWRMDKNYGHRVIWDQELLERGGISGQYIVTDPDLDLSGIPDDFLSVLQEGLRRYPKAQKCGFSLDISDLPEGDVKKWESTLWQKPLDDMYFRAGVDTTFALYRENVRHYSIWDSLRTNKPYMARHVPWEYNNMKDLPADEQYYFKTCNKSSSGKERIKV